MTSPRTREGATPHVDRDQEGVRDHCPGDERSGPRRRGDSGGSCDDEPEQSDRGDPAGEIGSIRRDSTQFARRERSTKRPRLSVGDEADLRQPLD